MKVAAPWVVLAHCAAAFNRLLGICFGCATTRTCPGPGIGTMVQASETTGNVIPVLLHQRLSACGLPTGERWKVRSDGGGKWYKVPRRFVLQREGQPAWRAVAGAMRPLLDTEPWQAEPMRATK